MTDNEIIEALKRCPQHTECCYCNSLEECGNKRILTTSVFDLINRQKAEINNLKAEIAEHKAMLEAFDNELVSFNKAIKTAKSEAIKEFAERLKEKCYEDFQETYEMLSPYVTDDDIDNLVEEMTEENK